MSGNVLAREIARRVAGHLRNGDVVNLGIGIPTLVADHVPDGVRVFCRPRTG